MTELSGFEVLALIKEIGSTLRGTYVNNIYTLGDAQLLRFRKPGAEEVWLVASPSLGVWVSEKVVERAETTEFTSRLRGELERARFAGASQVDLDRVFELTFGEGELTRKLIVELMPPGNIILTDRAGRILLVKDEVRSASRRLIRGGVYTAPAQRRLSPSSVGPEEVLEMAKAEKTVGKAIGKHVALPRKYVAEALSRLSLDEGADSSLLKDMGAEVAGVLREMLEEAREKPHPCVCETQGGDEIFVVTPRSLKVKKESLTVSALCDEILLRDAIESAVPADSGEDRERRELEATISKLRSEETPLLLEASRLRSLAAAAAGAASAADATKIVTEGGLKPRANPASPAAAASLLYDWAKELEDKAADARETVARLSRRVPKVKAEGRPATKRLARRKQEWYEKFRWFFTSEGRLAIGGRDAHSNELLVRRHLQDGDVVYHADLFGSPFFVLKGGKVQTETEVREVAQGTVAFSSAWKTGLASADAYWVNPDQVGSAAPSGEYLPRGSFAIKGRKNFVTKNIVEVAVGIDEDGRLVSGPEAALMKSARSYLILRPQREKGSETAKRVLKDLQPALEGRVLGLTVDDVLRALPAGGGKVVRKAGAARTLEGHQ
ncbi:MAG: NFACT RNA binding domain-containing protein [Nitrososphaerales archaeon]